MSKGSQYKYYNIQANQKVGEFYLVKDSQKRYHKKNSHSDSYGNDKQCVRHSRGLLGKHLKIRFGNCYKDTDNEGCNDN